MSGFEDEETVGLLTTESGDSVVIGLDRGIVRIEVANEGREPVEIWLTPDDARLLADLVRRAAGE